MKFPYFNRSPDFAKNISGRPSFSSFCSNGSTAIGRGDLITHNATTNQLWYGIS